MKNNILRYLCLVALAIFTACDKDNVRVDIPTPPDTMNLQSSTTNVELKRNHNSDIAVALTWNPAAPRGEKIDYVLKVDLEEDNFGSKAIVRYIPNGEYSYSFTHQELVDMLKIWNINDNSQQSLAVEVIAKIDNPSQYLKPEVSRTTFFVKGYSTDLYLLGPGTTIGDDLSNAMKLTETVSGSHYIWWGWLNGGDIYFVTTKSAYTPAFGRGADNWTLEYYETGDVPGINVPGMGYYQLTLDLSTNKFDRNEDIRIIGSGCVAGWNIGNSIPLTRPNRDERCYIFEGMLMKDGEVKFPLHSSYNWDVPFLVALEQGTAAEGTTSLDYMHGYSDEADRKWIVPKSGYYKVTLNTQEKWVNFDCRTELPYTRIWLVGDATPGGWYCDPFRIELEYLDSGIFWWEGALTAGEFKFPLAESTYEIPFLMPANVDETAHASLSETSIVVVEPEEKKDNKWLVTESEAGNYRIEVNILTMNVKFTKLD